MASIVDPAVSETMCAVQIQDFDAKIDQAIENTIRLLRIAVTNAAANAEMAIASMIGTPTISRVLCNHIVFGCYGLPPSYSFEAEGIFSKIVWSNLGRYMGHAWINVFTFPVSATLMTEAPAAARMVIKCACDLIIILDKGFRDCGKALTMQRLKQISEHYMRSKIQVTNRDGRLVYKSRRKLVHSEVNDIFPFHRGLALTVQVHTMKRISTIRDGCRSIIHKYRFQKAEELAPSIIRRSLSTDSETIIGDDESSVLSFAELDEDKDDIQAYEFQQVAEEIA